MSKKNETQLAQLIDQREAQSVILMAKIKDGNIKPEALENALIQLKGLGHEIGALTVWRDQARRIDNLVTLL